MIGERNISLDLMRVIACLGVITIHVAGSPIYHGMVEEGSLWWYECMIINAIVRWSVPVFVMLTGYFMLNPNKELTIENLFKLRVSRLVVALIFWTFFYALTLHWHFYPFGGQNSHFWYMGMCIGLYISLPVLRLIAQNEKVLVYACWIWLFVRIYYFIGKYVELPVEFTDYVFTDYVGYCLWGYYLSTWRLPKRLEYGLYALGVLSIVMTGLMVFFWNMNSVPEMPNVIFTSLPIFYFALHHPIAEHKWTKVLTELSKVSLGIYMVHIFVLTEIFFRMHRFIHNPLILIPLCVMAVFVIGGWYFADYQQVTYNRKVVGLEII